MSEGAWLPVASGDRRPGRADVADRGPTGTDARVSERWLPSAPRHVPRDRLPFWLVAYLVLLPAQVPLPLLARLAPSDICLLVFAVTAAGQLKVRRGSFSGWHLALVGIFSVGLLYAAVVNNVVTFYGVGNKYAGLFVLLLGHVVITAYASTPQRAQRLLGHLLRGVVAFTSVTLVIYVLALVAGAPRPPFSFGGRYAGLLIDPNAQGGLLALALILHLATSGRSSAPLSGRWGTAATIVLPLALVATGSRSAWLGAALGLGIVLLRQPVQATRFLMRAAAPVLASAVVFGFGVAELSGDSLERSSTIGQRIEIIDTALSDARREPLLGGGLGTYFARHGEIVHNTPIWFLTDLGVVGLTVFGGLVLWIAGQGVLAGRRFRSDRGLIVGLIIAHVVMVGLSAGIEAFSQRHWWLVMAVLAGLGASARHPEETPR